MPVVAAINYRMQLAQPGREGNNEAQCWLSRVETSMRPTQFLLRFCCMFLFKLPTHKGKVCSVARVTQLTYSAEKIQ